MRKTVLLFLIAISFINASAQWIQRTSFPGGGRTKATSFRIGDKMYLIGGLNSSNLTLRDVWEYDMINNSWSRKNDFPGPERYGAVGFVISNFGYIATGGNDNGYLDDIWKYDPSTDSWTQRGSMPAGQPQHENQRAEAFAFVIGTKAYIGGGNGFVFGPNSTNNIAFYDLWEYNPAGSTWTTKSDFPDFIGRNMSVAGVINGKAYVGLGCNVTQDINHKSFLQYDATLDSWSAKSDFPTLFTTDANAFVLDSQLYIAGGVNLNPVSFSSQVYRYDPVSDAWFLMPTFTGSAIAGAISASFDSVAFLGTGYRSNLTLRTDLWEYNAINTGISVPVSDINSYVKVFPNPFSESTTFYNGDHLKNSMIEIFDACGMKVRELELSTSNNQFIRGDLESGIYVYSVISNGKTIDRGKLIVE
jgi:N-acetylneuraminic acid mutarotase